jgi:hypothetical protein
MTAPHPRNLVVALTIAVLGWLALSASASLAASPNTPFVGSFHDQQAVSETVAGDYPCFEGLTGTITGTYTQDGHFINAPDVFHFTSTETLDYRIAFSDGRYVVGGFAKHLVDISNAQSGIQRVVKTEAGHERATVYAADGSPTGTVTVSQTTHTTIADLNDNHQIDPGEITASVDRFGLTCS